MIGDDGETRDLASLVIPLAGSLRATCDPFEPYELCDVEGGVVVPVAEYLKDLQACGRSGITQRSYGIDLLRWFRFVWAIRCPWEQATRVEARDFCRWHQIAAKPSRPHWRTGLPEDGAGPSVPVAGRQAPGTPNPVTGKPGPGRTYAPTTMAHCETVLRGFYQFHLEAGTGPMVNPFPLARGGRAHARHNPVQPFGRERAGLYRPRLAHRVPRHIPDEMFNELFVRLRSDRDRALVAFWISTGARASELLGVLCGGADAGQQLITVIRKGARALQPLPASGDAFVWLRLYQQQMHGLVPAGADDPLWWTLRRPFRPLAYHAARAMFQRASAALGASYSLHDLRHSAAYRLARDPLMPITDVQWVLGHAHLTTTQIYVTATAEDVVESVLGHHRRRAERTSTPPPVPQLRYRPDTLDTLFGRKTP